MAGCVFLPAAGIRYNYNVQAPAGVLSGVDINGYYWSNDYFDADFGYYLSFSNSNSNTDYTINANALSIRCVQ